MIEHRLPARLTEYWERVKQKNIVPSIDMFNSQAIDDMWQRCFKVSLVVKNNQPIYTYDFIGKELEGIFGVGLAGKEVKEKLGFMPAREMMEQMDKIIKNPCPITIEGQFIDSNSKVIKYRACMLPFGKNKESISNFIIGISWKAF